MKNLRLSIFTSLIMLFTACGGGGGGVSGGGDPASNDTTSPVITLNGNNSMTIIFGDAYNEPGAIALDDTDGAVPIKISGTVNTSVIGTYIVTYSATDNVNNTANKTRIVNVVDISAPVVTVVGNNPETVIQGDIYTDAGATAIDDADGDVTANIVTANQVNIAVLGTYSVTYNVYDSAGNAATQVTRSVNVIPIVTRWDEAQFDTGNFSSETFLTWDQSIFN